MITEEMQNTVLLFATPVCTRAALAVQFGGVGSCALGSLAHTTGRHAVQASAVRPSAMKGWRMGACARRGSGARRGALGSLAGVRRGALRGGGLGVRGEHWHWRGSHRIAGVVESGGVDSGALHCRPSNRTRCEAVHCMPLGVQGRWSAGCWSAQGRRAKAPGANERPASPSGNVRPPSARSRKLRGLRKGETAADTLALAKPGVPTSSGQACADRACGLRIRFRRRTLQTEIRNERSGSLHERVRGFAEKGECLHDMRGCARPGVLNVA